MSLRDDAPLWLAVAVGGMLASGCEPAPNGPLTDYQPLAVPPTAPLVLQDADETRRFVNAFPMARYQRFAVPGAGEFFVDDAQDYIKGWVSAGAQWDPHVLALCEAHARPGTVVVEVGAHIGTHTIPLAHLVGPWGRVYAFEPQRKLYRELHHNLALNGIANVVPLRFAVGDGDARIVTMDAPSPGNEGGTAIGRGGDRVELRSLDSFAFERVSVIKIDAEGFERHVLRGAEETIRRNRSAIVVEIMGGWQPFTVRFFGGRELQHQAPEILDHVHGTWGDLEALGYSVDYAGGQDYIALPSPGDARVP